MGLPIIFSIDDDAQVLRAITRDLKSKVPGYISCTEYGFSQRGAGKFDGSSK